MNVKAVQVFLVSLSVAFAPISLVRAQALVEQISPAVSTSEMPPAPGAVRTAEGGQLISSDAYAAQQMSGTQKVQSSGGPDDFGYTWSDSVPYSWISAATGAARDYATPVDIGFSFKFYENLYSQIYISPYGFLSFNNDYLDDVQSDIPDPSLPNDVIAPHWAPMSANGYIRYLRGGSAPNRFIVIEWNHLVSSGLGSDEVYTFEAVLYESGDIVFQYATMTADNNWWCQSSGIEDSIGLDSLATSSYCTQIPSNHAVRIYRPAPSAHISIVPRELGGFAAPGGIWQFDEVIRNGGDLAVDTYDLITESTWPITVYAADGITPMGDTNGNAIPDTGPIALGASKSIVLKVVAPASAIQGQYSDGQLTVRSWADASKSKTVPVRVAMPVPFAQSYTKSDQPYVSFNRMSGSLSVQTLAGGSSQNAAVATTPDGNIVQVWERYQSYSSNYYARELYYAVLDRFGHSVRAPTKLTNHSTTTIYNYDSAPAVAVAPNGNIAIVWHHHLWNTSNSTGNYNVYYMILNSGGGVVVPATSLTGDSQWDSGNGTSSTYSDPNVAATTDNHFVMVWDHWVSSGSSSQETVWYAVRDSVGSTVKVATQFSTSGSLCDYNPNLTSLANGTVFLSYSNCGRITIGRLDSSGNVLVGPTVLATNERLPDAVQLPNGNIVLAMSHWNGVRYHIQYVVLNSSLTVIQSATDLADASLVGDYAVSVTYSGNQTILTWSDICHDVCISNLYYALLDDVGNVLTRPIMFAGSHLNHVSMGLPSNGQGNTYLPPDTTAPTNPTYLSSTSHRVSDWSSDNTIQVYWYGASDADSGLDGYSVVWDHSASTIPGASKTLEQDVNTLTSAALADGTWYFHIRAVDNAGNWATGAAHLGPFMIDATGPQVRGRVTNNRGEPVLNALVTSDPPALNTARSDVMGNYTLFYSTSLLAKHQMLQSVASGIYTLTVQRTGYGIAPAMSGVVVSGVVSDVNLTLPPQVDGVNGGTFETPASSAWSGGAQISATVEVSAAHTGQYGLDLQSKPAPGLSSAAVDAASCVTQSVVISASWQHPALSWMSRVVAGNGSQALVMSLSGTQEISQSVMLTPGGWTQGWLDARGLSGQTATLSLCFTNSAAGQQVYVDEVSLGESQAGALRIYLPQVRR